MSTILETIVRYKKEEFSSLRRKVSLKEVKSKASDAEPAFPFLSRFTKGAINVIAEIKKASPSAGVIRPDFKPVDLGFRLSEGGAAALSILTDEHFFQGSLSILTEVKKKVKIPCLRKDFTLDEYHLFEARGAGADAVLLLVAILDDHQIRDFAAVTLELGMTPLVEIHSEVELDRVLDLKKCLLGVNNRNLADFSVDLKTSRDLIRKIPRETPAISESGLNVHEELVGLLEAGFAGFLIGEVLMREKDPAKKLRELMGMSLRA